MTEFVSQIAQTPIDISKYSNDIEKWPSNTIIKDIKVKYNSKDNQPGTNSTLISGFIDSVLLSDGNTSKELGNQALQGEGVNISANCPSGFDSVNLHKFDRQYINNLYPPVNSFRTKPFGTYSDFYKIEATCNGVTQILPQEDLPASKNKSNIILKFDKNNNETLVNGTKIAKNFITDIKYNLDNFTINKFNEWIPNMRINHISGRSTEVIDNIFFSDLSSSVLLGTKNAEMDNIKKLLRPNSPTKPLQDISINCANGFDNVKLFYWDRDNAWYKNYFFPDELSAITDFYKLTATCGNQNYELNSIFGNDPLKSKDIPKYENNKIKTKDFDKTFFYEKKEIIPVATPIAPIEKKEIIPVVIPTVEEEVDDPFYKKWWFWAIIIVCCCLSSSIIAGIIYFNSKDSKSE